MRYMMTFNYEFRYHQWYFSGPGAQAPKPLLPFQLSIVAVRRMMRSSTQWSR